MVSGLLLVVAVLAFAGLAYQSVPMSTTQTVTQESTGTQMSYSPYTATNTITYAVTHSYPYSTALAVAPEPSCYGILEPPYYPCFWITFTSTNYTSYTQTFESTYERQSASLVSYSQTLTSSVTESSTSLVPASTALELTDGTFAALAVVVIGILGLLTAYAALKPRTTHRPKQATLTQFTKE